MRIMKLLKMFLVKCLSMLTNKSRVKKKTKIDIICIFFGSAVRITTLWEFRTSTEPGGLLYSSLQLILNTHIHILTRAWLTVQVRNGDTVKLYDHSL